MQSLSKSDYNYLKNASDTDALCFINKHVTGNRKSIMISIIEALWRRYFGINNTYVSVYSYDLTCKQLNDNIISLKNKIGAKDVK